MTLSLTDGPAASTAVTLYQVTGTGLSSTRTTYGALTSGQVTLPSDSVVVATMAV